MVRARKNHMTQNAVKTYVIGDIHGNFRALKQCLEKSKFDYEVDHLICLGDIVDSWPDVRECIDELLKIKNCHLVLGNHDWWALEWYDREHPQPYNRPENYWISQGGEATYNAYKVHDYDQLTSKMPDEHLAFLKKWHPYIIYGNTVFVHGGFDPNQKDPKKWRTDEIIWDRALLQSAWHKQQTNPSYKFGGWDEIFVGHTTTQAFKSHTSPDRTLPLHLCNLWDLDTGAGWDGKLTIMNVDTHEYWQSDNGRALYPDAKGRF